MHKNSETDDSKSNQKTKIKKIAILGGGFGALASAWKIKQKSPETKITIYQMGWRLGGKGANGRNSLHHDRIQEHGIHIFAGFYKNIISIMTEVYELIKRPSSSPIPTWQDAAKPLEYIGWLEYFGGKWVKWQLKLSTKIVLPLTLLTQIATYFFKILNYLPLLSKVISVFLSGLILGLWNFFYKKRIKILKHRQHWVFIHLAVANLLGAIKEKLFIQDSSVIDHYDYREWISQYLIDDSIPEKPDGITLYSPPITSIYGATYAYQNGLREKENLSASIVWQTLIKTFSQSKKSFFYKLLSGMGEIIFAPYYQALKKQGVEFKFFHQVKELVLSEDKKNIQKIIIANQATLKNPNDEYQPLVKVKGLPSWPSEALLDQLASYKDTDFESWYSQGICEIVLEYQKDFDHIIYGMSLGTVPYICEELINENNEWKNMVEKMETVRTFGVQTWTTLDREALGPIYQSGDSLGSYIYGTSQYPSLSITTDKSDTLKRESWNGEAKGVFYWTGVMPDGPETKSKSGVNQESPKELDQPDANETAVEVLFNLLKYHINPLWPNATTKTGELKPDVLYNFNQDLIPIKPSKKENLTKKTKETKKETIQDELYDIAKSQFAKGNIQPSERYVLSLKGTNKYRLYPTRTGFNNLYLAGDFTNHGFNVGTAESATMSGITAGEALVKKQTHEKE